MKGDIICLVYIEDTILSGPNLDYIKNEIKGLGISTEEQTHTLQLRDEGQVGDFLGIHIEKLEERKFNLTQTGLANKVLKTSNMKYYNYVPTISSTKPLEIDKDGQMFEQSGNMLQSWACGCTYLRIQDLTQHMQYINVYDSCTPHVTLIPHE